jgi:hypothetical protein
LVWDVLMAKQTIHSMLLEGRHRLAVARVREVAELVAAEPKTARRLVECLFDEDAGVANRAADALERASYRQPSLLATWKDLLLGRMIDAEENKLRWNLALMAGRLELTVPETRRVAAILKGWLEDGSSAVKACAMEGLAGMAKQNKALMPEVLDLLRILTRSGTPAMRARGRIVLKRMERAVVKGREKDNEAERR